MAEGKSVKLDGIGTFSPSLALCKDKEREKTGEGETHRNARSIVVGSVNFRVDRKMVRRINGRCLLKELRGSRNALHRSIHRSND